MSKQYILATDSQPVTIIPDQQDVPSIPINVLQIVNSTIRWRQQAALVDAGGSKFLMTLRTGRRWKLPKSGKQLEVLAWLQNPDITTLPDPVDQPAEHATVYWLTR